MYMCVCMYVRVYVYMYVGMHVCVYICMYVCMYVRTCICMYVGMRMRMCMYVCICVCMYICMYVYICMCVFIFFIKACPIKLGNTTCRVNLVVHQKASFAVSLYVVQNFFWFQLCYSKSKSIDSIKVMNGFRNFVINFCLRVGQWPGWTMFFFRVPLCFSTSMHWYSVSVFAGTCCVVQ